MIYICVWGLSMLYNFLPVANNENESIYCIVGIILFVTFIADIVCNIVAGNKAVKGVKYKTDYEYLCKLSFGRFS